MRDLTELAAAIREALQQQQAVTQRLLDLAAKLEAEALVVGESTASVPYDSIVSEWNSRCASKGMKRRNTAGELKTSMLRIWRKHPGIDVWKAAFDACGRDAWWRGEKGWQGNLESFLRPTNYGKFFDEAVAAAPVVEPEGASLQTRSEDEIDAILADKRRPLPSGFTGNDPREVRGVDDVEFVKRYEALKTWLRYDWRFS